MPPQCFIEAVINEPKPNSDEYSNVMKQILFDGKDRSWRSEHCIYCRSNQLQDAHLVQEEFDISSKIEITNYDGDNYEDTQKKASFKMSYVKNVVNYSENHIHMTIF